jgi:hypothetical protein
MKLNKPISAQNVQITYTNSPWMLKKKYNDKVTF